MHFQCKALAATHFKRECKIRKECRFRVCMVENRHGSHTITRLTVHIVWVTKYRYKVVKKTTGGALKFLSPLQATGHYGIFPTDRTTALQFGRPKGRGIKPSRD